MPLSPTFSGRVMFRLNLDADVHPLARFMAEREVQINYLHALGKYVMSRFDRKVSPEDIDALKTIEGVEEVDLIHKQVCM